MKNLLHIQREHLLSLKLAKGSDNKDAIQKIQQAYDNGTYGAKEYKTTREKLSREEFVERFANPPKLDKNCKEVYTYLGGMFIQLLKPFSKDKEHRWYNGDEHTKKMKSLAKLEKHMCDVIFDKSY